MPFSEQLRRYRRERGLTQEQLAELAGLSPRGIRALEQGERSRPHKETVSLLASGLGLSSGEQASFERAASRSAAAARFDGEPHDIAPSNLPAERTVFFGREREIERLVDLLLDPRIRMLTLTGSAGTGKTRLALRVAATLLSQYRDGVFLVPLASLSQPAVVPEAIAEVLGVKEERGKDLNATLIRELQNQQLLLVLDNFEHLLGAGQAVSSLLDSCPDIDVLVTSRVRLQLLWEHEHMVPPLVLPDAERATDLENLSRCESVALFVDRAGAAGDTFALTRDNAPAVAEICIRLDGLPLAIELAATRTKLFPPQALLRHLSSRLTLLTGTAMNRPSRHQTLRAAIDWSYSLLSEDERTLFARLSVFAGNWSFEAAQDVCAGGGNLDVLEGLASLVDKSLVRQEGEEEARFSLLETIREYAGEKLSERGEASDLRYRHAQYFARLMDAAKAGIRSRQPDALQRVRRESENIHFALEWLHEHDMPAALRMGALMSSYWPVRAVMGERTRWLDDVRSWSHLLSRADRAEVLEAAAILLETDESQRLAWYEESQRLYRELGHQGACADLVALAAWKALDAGNTEQATCLLDEGMELVREVRSNERAESAVKRLGLVAERLGRLAEAAALARQGLRMAERRHDTHDVAARLGDLADIALLRGEVAEARRQYDESLELRRQLQDRECSQHPLHGLAIIAMAGGDAVRALQLSHEHHSLARGTESEPESLNLLGHAHFSHGDLAEATSYFRACVQTGHNPHDGVCLAESLLGLAGIAAREGRNERAARLAAAAQVFGASLSRPVSLLSSAQRELYLRPARVALELEVWDAAWEGGTTLTEQQAIAYALE